MLSPRDRISKASSLLMEASKDATGTSLATAIQEQRFKLEPAQTRALHDLIQRSIDAGYNRAYANFMREVDTALAAMTPPKK